MLILAVCLVPVNHRVVACLGLRVVEGIRLVSEKERWEMKLERLRNRTEKVWRELVKSSLTGKDKAELYGSFWGFIGGLGTHLEEQCPELKAEH